MRTDSASPYTDLCRAFFLIADGNRSEGLALAKGVLDSDPPLDLSTSCLLILHLAGEFDQAKLCTQAQIMRWQSAKLDPWNGWMRDNLLEYFLTGDEVRLLGHAQDDTYMRKWLSIAHSTIAASRFGRGDMQGAKEHALDCIKQHVFYLTDHACWRAIAKRRGWSQ